MKKVLIPLIAFLALTVNAHAQDKMGKKANQHHKHEKGMMAKELNFTDAQKAQAKAINEDSHKKLQELNKNESITVKEQRDRKAAIFKERKTKMTQLKAERKVKKEEGYAKRLDKIKTNLSLTDEQVAKLKNQRAATLAKAEKIKNNESLSREQKKEQMMTLKTEAKAQYDKIFTADQLKKKEEMKKAHGDRGRVRK
jgi:Spy/CpxP family protein refolding chaperone